MFLVRKCVKTINADLPKLMNQKGCDASNAFDEELSDQEFSDDEAEAAFKRAKKNNKKRGQANKDLEDGEVVEDFKPKRPKQNFNPNKH